MAVGGVYLCMQVVPVCGVFVCVYMQVVSTCSLLSYFNQETAVLC